MINFKNITQAVETIFNDNLNDYTVTRNAERNVDPGLAAKNSGWIGIYRGSIVYDTVSTGASPWLAEVDIKVEVQVASIKSGDDAEDRLQDAEQAVMNVLNDNKTLSGTVTMTVGYTIDYEYNADNAIYWHASIITLKTQVRT